MIALEFYKIKSNVGIIKSSNIETLKKTWLFINGQKMKNSK